MNIFERVATRLILKPLADYIVTKAQSGELIKQDTKGVIRDQYTAMRSRTGRQSGAGVSFEVLRRFSVQYDIARMCINRRKRQITGLEWDIVAAESDDKKDYTTIIQPLKQQFKGIGGYKVRFREFLDLIIEDLLVLDAVALEKINTRGGQLLFLKPIDGATIKLKTTDSGDTPMPPEIAYAQEIRGNVVGEWNADEMYYEMMNPRTNSAYGLSPLESFVLGISAALKSDVYNLGMLSEGNIPEGFFSVPEGWSPAQIKEFQQIFDAMMSGDAGATARIKFMPQGSYQATKKPEDMRYQELQMWLMKKMCALYDVPPQEIGFTETVNRSTGEVQSEIATTAGVQPLAQFLQEIFTEVIQLDLGYPQLKFKFIGLEDKDEKRTAEINEIKIRSGQVTVDEIRQADGLAPIGVSKPFVIGSPTFIDDESIADKAARDAATAEILTNARVVENPVDNKEQQENEAVENSDKATKAMELISEMRAFRKYAINRVKEGKKPRNFESTIIPTPALNELNELVKSASSADEIKKVFSDFMQDYQIDFLADLAAIKQNIDRVL